MMKRNYLKYYRKNKFHLIKDLNVKGKTKKEKKRNQYKRISL